MTRYVSVFGTHAWRQDRIDWWHPKSAFSLYMKVHRFDHAKPFRPFIWSGDIDGALWANGNDWEAGAAALVEYLEDLPYDWRNIIAHSHGGQVALIAAREIAMRSLVMIATPIREEIETRVAPIALANIGTCVHVTDPNRDWMGFLGGLFDGRWSTRRTFDVPGIRTVRIKGIGHSGMLCEQKHFPKWNDEGLLDALSGESLGVGA